MPFILVESDLSYDIGVWKISESEEFFKNSMDYIPRATNAGKRLQQYAARAILAKMKPDFPLGLVMQEEQAKPFLSNGGIYFNMSHTSEMAAAIISDSKHVGVDIEKIDERVQKIKNRFLHPQELDIIGLLGEDVYNSALTLSWSIKETVFKWWGKGGVDFANNIHIKQLKLDNRATLEVEFHSNISYSLNVHCFKIENHWLTYVVQ